MDKIHFFRQSSVPHPQIVFTLCTALGFKFVGKAKLLAVSRLVANFNNIGIECIRKLLL